MSQEVLIDVYLVSDTDAWKIIFVTGKRNYAKVFHKQDRLQDVQSKLLELVEKIEHSLPDTPRSRTPHETDPEHPTSCPNCGNGYVSARSGEPWKCTKCGMPEVG